MKKYDSLYERLVANSAPVAGQNENGCWQWVGNTDSKGYGRVSIRLPGRKNPTGMRAHRLMEGVFRAPEGDVFAVFDPDTETIEHLCQNTGCVNPDHWVFLTRAENTAAMQARKLSALPRAHDWTAERCKGAGW